MEYTINIKGRLMDLSTPQVMGILNVTPDSFYSGSRKQTEMEIAQLARAHGSYPWCRGFESPSRYYTKDESVNRVKGLQAFLCCRHIHTKIYKISFYYCHNPQNPL